MLCRLALLEQSMSDAVLSSNCITVIHCHCYCCVILGEVVYGKIEESFDPDGTFYLQLSKVGNGFEEDGTNLKKLLE